MTVGIGIGQPERLATHIVTIQFADEFKGKSKEEIRKQVREAFRFLLGYDRMELVKVETIEEAARVLLESFKK